MSSISKVGDNFIATWFYRESKDDYSVYTNVAMSSYSAKFYELYLKATLNFFTYARLFNPNVRLIFLQIFLHQSLKNGWCKYLQYI